MSTVRAILIDINKQAVREVSVEDSLPSYYATLGCDLIEAVYPQGLAAGDCVYVDEEGLFKEPAVFFHWRGFHQPLAGSGLVVGTDDDGNTVDCKTSLEQVKARVRF